MENYVIGIIAALLTTFGFVPQIIKMYNTKSAKDISIITLFQFTIGASLWAIYGMRIGDYIIMLSNIVVVSSLVIAIILYHCYNNYKKDNITIKIK